MSVKQFKFVSPGVFINEIDNSFIPRSPTEIGPAVVGRATTGLAMKPVRVESYSDFVRVFGDTVPGNAGGDVFRNGLQTQSPMYGLYGAKAFLNAGIAPLTYVRTLGHQHPDADSGYSAQAGWKTSYLLSTAQGGGAYGLFVGPSGTLPQTGSLATGTGGTYTTGTLACIWYTEAGMMMLSGTSVGSASVATRLNYKGVGTVILSDSDGNFKAVHLDGAGEEKVYEFNLQDTSTKYVRQVFNTNPMLSTGSDTLYPSSARRQYWLGESYDQEVRDRLAGVGGAGSQLWGTIVPIHLSSSYSTITPANRMGANCVAREAVAGWFIGQDDGVAEDFNVLNAQKLFRLIGRGHGSWLNKNAKVSIANIRQSNTSATDYGTFSVLIRAMSDSDNAVQILERFDECSLDPTSPNYIARKIGDRYLKWSESEKRNIEYGEYDNQSKYVYVEVQGDVAAGASGLEKLLPFGYYGPPKWKDAHQVMVTSFSASAASASTDSASRFITLVTGSTVSGLSINNTFVLSASHASDTGSQLQLSLEFPSVRLRNSASDGGISDPRRAYFGFQPTRASGSSRFDAGAPNVQDLLSNQFGALADNSTATITGIDPYSYIFTLDNVTADPASTTTLMFYKSGSRRDDLSYTAMSGGYTALLDAGFQNFTAPFWGGFDGFNIKVPDPLWNKGMSTAATERNSAAYYTWKRAIDTLAEPEEVEMNMIVAPGLTNDSLTQHIVDVCEARSDAMAIIDLPNVYIPSAEEFKSTPADRVLGNPQSAATALRDRGIDTSYGSTFYPWVQTRDAQTGAAVWVPPSVAMLGVLASSQKKAQLWFAPAGFNRGGLSEGAAGIPITAVTEKLTSKQRDLLYEANINPIASFPSSGIVVFGQKTLQQRQSALDRINVRRLVIYLKKQISVISTKILFEQNVQTTWNRFIGLVEPFLANVKSNFGISDYKLILDSSTTTPDLIDQNIMYAKIMVKPARSIEYIAIDFVIASTGASFDD